jgi:hypothetical protein
MGNVPTFSQHGNLGNIFMFHYFPQFGKIHIKFPIKIYYQFFSHVKSDIGKKDSNIFQKKDSPPPLNSQKWEIFRLFPNMGIPKNLLCYTLYNKTFIYWDLVKAVRFVAPRQPLLPSASPRATTAVSGPQNTLFPSVSVTWSLIFGHQTCCQKFKRSKLPWTNMRLIFLVELNKKSYFQSQDYWVW